METWLDDFDGDLYGKELRVAFYRYLRPERTFPDLESLKREILRNRQQARDYFSDMELPSPWGQIDDRTD